MADDDFERFKRLPGGSRGRRQSAGDLPAAMRKLKAETLKAGKERIMIYPQVGTRNGGPTATNIRAGKVAGLLGFNADWRWDQDRQVLRFSYTGRWHGRPDPPADLEPGPFGYAEDYELCSVTNDASKLD